MPSFCKKSEWGYGICCGNGNEKGLLRQKRMRVIHLRHTPLQSVLSLAAEEFGGIKKPPSLCPTTFDGYVLRIDCGKAEEGLKTTPCSECALNALAIDNPLEYATLYLEGGIQTWVDAEDSLEP